MVGREPVIFAVSGVKNSGKTTLITKLLPYLKDRGVRVATIKHDGHSFEPDVPGTDSYRHRKAGADATAVFSEKLAMVIRQETVKPEQLFMLFDDMDLILLEGFKDSRYPKLELVREGNSEKCICAADTLVAVVTDKKEYTGFPENIPVLDLNHPKEIAEVICKAMKLDKQKGRRKMGKVMAVCTSPEKGTQKKNVEEINIIEGFGLEGDAHGGDWHRQVSLLSYEKIEEFRARGAKVAFGAFGENLVISGYDFKTLPIGTRFVCNDVVLELTQIGKKCHNGCEIYKVMGDCIMPREGVFCKVIHGGHVKVGDTFCIQEE